MWGHHSKMVETCLTLMVSRLNLQFLLYWLDKKTLFCQFNASAELIMLLVQVIYCTILIMIQKVWCC
jgi:hypothetical protein